MAESGNRKRTYEIPTIEDLFAQYDADGNGFLTKEEFQQLLWDIDGLDGVAQKAVNEYVEEEFEKADLNHDEFISADEFSLYYYAELCFKFPVYKNGHNPGASLYNVFVAYCSFGKGVQRCEEMEGHCFARLSKDCHLLTTKECGKASIDIVFYRARAARIYNKELGATKLQFPEFLFALQLIGEKRRSGFEEVVNRVLKYAKCRRAHTMADFVVFDACDYQKKEKRLLAEWSGAGNSKIDLREKNKLNSVSEGSFNTSDSISDESPAIEETLEEEEPSIPDEVEDAYSQDSFVKPSLKRLPSAGAELDQSSKNVERKSKWAYETLGHFEFGACGEEALRDCEVLWKVRQLNEDDITMALKRVFERYNVWEHGASRSRMDKMRFHKVLRDAQFLTTAFTTQTIDQVFSKVRPASEYRVNFIQFIEGLRFVAMHSRLSLNEIMERIVAVGGPIVCEEK
ncbi:hypothetical protein BSKO_10472 [Bryopsis sp. KO-2023]|nr:hypothetical protein BSKO_10472 [Bryopsis sp. KO-2023]